MVVRVRSAIVGVFLWVVASGAAAQPAADPSAAIAELDVLLEQVAATRDPGMLADLHAELLAWHPARTGCDPGDLPRIPAWPVRHDDLLAAIASLRAAAETCAGRAAVPFRLGHVERVTVTAEERLSSGSLSLANPVPIASQPRTAGEALATLPGIAPHLGANRNERTVTVRGFGVRQVPVYVDGIPVYLPYDGSLDLGRFLLADIAEIQVGRAFTSPLYGANALGGAINLISRQPLERKRVDADVSYGDGEAVSGRVGAASRMARGWVMGDLAFSRRSFLPLSAAFEPAAGQPDARRRNSDHEDVTGRLKGSVSVGAAEFVAGYSGQAARKGNPAYVGANPAVQRRYWRWPRWDSRTAYAVAAVAVSDGLRLRARAYRHAFANELRAYDDETFTSQWRPSSFTSFYDDETAGGVLEADLAAPGRHSLRAALSHSASRHQEWNAAEPARISESRTTSLGLEDRMVLGARATARFGVTADRLRITRADDWRNGAIEAMPTGAESSLNPQASLLVSAGSASTIRVTFARRTRLPTVKERYSYRQGRALPNPSLREERARHAEISASWSRGARLQAELTTFWSEISDVAERVYLQPNLYQLQNVGGARHLGVEGFARWRPSPAWRGTFGYSLLDRRLSDRPLRAIDTPRHRAFGSIGWTPVSRLTALADVEIEHGRWTQDEAGLYSRVPGGAWLAFAATLALSSHADVRVAVRNALDRNVYVVEGFPEAGRTAHVELRARF
jgi:iron complex outermembrane recepter protein